MLSQIKLYLILAGIGFTIASTAFVTHKVDNAKYLALELSYKEAETKAIQQALDRQKSIDELKNKQALAAIENQRKINKHTQAKLDEVNKTLKDSKLHCVTWGLVRLYNSTIESDPTKLIPTPSGESNDTCSAVTASRLARSIINNIGIAKQNAQQLNDLIRSIQELSKK